MRCIMCVDNSGSTAGRTAYWKKVSEVYEENKPQVLIYWNNVANIENNFVQKSSGGTEPQSFINLLLNEKTPYNLIISTDGEVYDRDIQLCAGKVTQEILDLINSTTIYYIGKEKDMNIGLNVIFGRTKHMSYHINETNYNILFSEFDKLNLDEFMSPNLAISLIVKIKNTELAYQDRATREQRLTELRGEICRLFSKLEHENLNKNVEDKLRTYFENNQIKEFNNVLNQDRLDVEAISRKKNEVLNLFDGKIDFNISRITAAPVIEEQNIEVAQEEESVWNDFEDVITLDKFNLPCILVQNTSEPLITDKMTLKHPFKILSQPDVIKNIMNLVEPNPIDYTTFRKLPFDSKGYTTSPYTRVKCKGVFVLDTRNMKSVKNNGRVMSVLFGNDNKVPGNLVLWNLVFTYILYKYKFNDTPYKSVIFDEIVTYCKEFSTSLSFSHQCQVLRPAKIQICLWYCIQAAPRICPNTAKNVLRSPFGLELLEFYLDTFGQEGDKYLSELVQRTRKWAMWNYLLANRGRPNLTVEVKAQYQNYCIHNDKLILLAGKCETAFPSKCNILDYNSVNTLFANLEDTSSKTDDIDKFVPFPVNVYDCDEEGVAEQITHVKINIKTCWPLVICPITKKHWKECIGPYDIKSNSHVRIFNTFCCKYETYPVHFMDLVLLYSQKNKDCILSKRHISNFEYVFSLFKDVMEKYSCKKYMGIYLSHTDENLRLLNE